MTRRPNPPGLRAYKIGGKERQAHWAHRWHVDRWFRSWQAEWNDCMWACRSWTRGGALRKARCWYYNGTDWAKYRRRHPQG